MSSAGYGGPEGPIVDVSEGMRVVDRRGEDVGTVEAVRMGDPEAVTPRGQDVGARSGLIEDVGAAFAGNDPPVPPEIAERLLRIGYVKIDGKGILDRDFYVLADQVTGVAGDVVRLSVDREELVRES
jgi:hypothetical protein